MNNVVFDKDMIFFIALLSLALIISYIAIVSWVRRITAPIAILMNERNKDSVSDNIPIAISITNNSDRVIPSIELFNAMKRIDRVTKNGAIKDMPDGVGIINLRGSENKEYGIGCSYADIIRMLACGVAYDIGYIVVLKTGNAFDSFDISMCDMRDNYPVKKKVLNINDKPFETIVMPFRLSAMTSLVINDLQPRSGAIINFYPDKIVRN